VSKQVFFLFGISLEKLNSEISGDSGGIVLAWSLLSSQEFHGLIKYCASLRRTKL